MMIASNSIFEMAERRRAVTPYGAIARDTLMGQRLWFSQEIDWAVQLLNASVALSLK